MSTDGAGVELVWHRRDLRLHDHAALHAAARSAGAVAGVFVLDPENFDTAWPRRRALLCENVRALRAHYERLGSRLYVRHGAPAVVLPELASALGAVRLHALRSATPQGRAGEALTRQALDARGVRLHLHEGRYIHAPGTILTKTGQPFSVFTPFARRWQERAVADELEPPRALRAPLRDVEAGAIPREPSDVPLPEPGEAAALARLEAFARERLAGYAAARDRLDGSGSSRLSIDLAIGTLSARTVLHRVGVRGGDGARKLVSELIWRDFMADLLHHRPHLPEQPFDARFGRLEWRDDDEVFSAWARGETGVPVVDAALRQLRATGWISNRARMIAAQFLAKHLRCDWRRGERLFRDLLLDADTASNVGNWQWAAGLGVDNAPWFRVFNPVTQGRDHDPGGRWIAHWVPESGGDPRPLPNAIVDIGAARRDYLAAVAALK